MINQSFRNGPLVVVAIDPGGRTGLAVMRCNYMHEGEAWGRPSFLDRSWTRLTLGPEEHHRVLYRMLEQWRTHNFVIICEAFHDRPGKAVVELASPEYIGVVKLFSQNEKVPVVWQEPSVVNGKDHFWSDDKLKRIELFQHSSSPHDRDATKHLLHWLTFTIGDGYYMRKLK